MRVEDFVGREAEARLILSNVTAGRSTLLIGEAGVGKTALLEYLEPVLKEEGQLIHCSRLSPFGAFLRECFTGLHDVGLVPEQTASLTDDLKRWGKQHGTNEEKARALLGIMGEHKGVIVVIDDASGITQSSRPWLEQLLETVTVLAATDPAALKKAGSKRFWKRFDEVNLTRLSKDESAELLGHLIERYTINADEPEVYKRRVLELAQGSPFELQRLVKYHSSEALVKTRDLGSYSQQFVERDVKQVAIAPLLLVFSAFVVAGRYIARAQDNQDMYVVSGILMAFMIVFSPWLRSALKPRSK